MPTLSCLFWSAFCSFRDWISSWSFSEASCRSWTWNHSCIKDCPIYLDTYRVAPCHQDISVVDTCWSAASSLCWELSWIIFSSCSTSAELWSPESFAEGLVSSCKHGNNHTKHSGHNGHFTGAGSRLLDVAVDFAVCTYSSMLLERFPNSSECLLCFRPVLEIEGEE